MVSAPEQTLQHFNQAADLYEKSAGGCTRELADRSIDLLPEILPDSVVLDNACGSGVVTLEALRREPSVRIHAVDYAPKMVEMVRSRFADSPNVTCDEMAGEFLTFPDDTFTHSITSLGIQFFTDPVKGAHQIFRTLKSGGTAVVTTWEELGYLPAMHKSQLTVRPNDTPFKVPIPEVWFQQTHVEKTMRDAGFKDVKIVIAEVYFTVESLPILFDTFVPWLADWSEAEKAQMKSLLVGNALEIAVRIRRDGQELLGIPMKAIVAVCKK
jgi:SAM-dependent methyltransferase